MRECPATVKIHDERWGIFINQCELNEGHPGDHRTAYTACDPVAYLSWSGTALNDGSTDAPSTDSHQYDGQMEGRSNIVQNDGSVSDPKETGGGLHG